MNHMRAIMRRSMVKMRVRKRQYAYVCTRLANGNGFAFTKSAAASCSTIDSSA